MLSASLNKSFPSFLSIKISTLVIDSNEFPITHQTAFPMFSTLTSFLYPAMHQARISNVRTLREKNSHIKLIFVKYIHVVIIFFNHLGSKLRNLFYLNSCFSIDNEIKSRLLCVYLLLVSSLIKPQWRTIPNCHCTVNICTVGIVQ